MNSLRLAFTSLLFIASTLVVLGQAGKTLGPADYAAQLSSTTNLEKRIAALESLAKAGTAARPQAAKIEKCLSDPDFKVAVTAAHALPDILGPEEAAKLLSAIVQDPANTGTSRAAALAGLETCGAFAMPALTSAINDPDTDIRFMAVTCAAHVDLAGALYDRILPLLYGRSADVAHAVRKYLLAQGILGFYTKEGRWPADVQETLLFLRKSNPVLNLDPLIKRGEIKLVVQEDGSLQVDGFYRLPKPGKIKK